MGGATWVAALAAWPMVVLAGFFALARYASTPGDPGPSAPQSWPRASALPRDPGAFTLVMFLHPHCPCSRASLAELGRLLARARGAVSPVVVFARPEGVRAGWEQSGLRELASSIPGIAIIDDRDSVEARRFGAVTSGAAFLYDRRGLLAFSGGITASRGHEGASVAQERILTAVNSASTRSAHSPVYGCPIEDSTEIRPGG